MCEAAGSEHERAVLSDDEIRGASTTRTKDVVLDGKWRAGGREALGIERDRMQLAFAHVERVKDEVPRRDVDRLNARKGLRILCHNCES